MKKRIIRAVCSKALAAAVGTAVLIQAQAPVLAGALENPVYISEVFLSYGETDDKAKQWLTDNGYTVLDQNLNESADGLMSTKRSVYLGYKTTTEADEAIRDMRVMNMNGDFSYEAYEKMLENRKAEIAGFIGNVLTALKEYRENYEAKRPKALIAHDNMNKYTDDDSDNAPLGDLLLKPVKEEMSEADYEKAKTEHADITTLMLQGNLDIVRDIMAQLAYAADTGEKSWLDRLGDANTPDELIEVYEDEYPALSESKLENLLISEFDEDAKAFTECLDEIRDAKEYIDEVGLPLDASEEDAKKYFDANPDKSNVTWAICAMTVGALEDVEYEGEKFIDFAVSEDNDFSDVEDRMKLYPILDALSPGQRAMLSYTDFSKMILSGRLDEAGWKKAYEQVKEETKDLEVSSAYSGIIRSAFEPGGVAITNEARNMQAATGQSFDDGLFGVGLDYKPIVGGVLTVTTFIIGGLALSKGNAILNTTVTVGDTAKQLWAQRNAVHGRIIEKAEVVRKFYGIDSIRTHGGNSFTFNSLNKYNEFYDLDKSFRDKVIKYYEDLGDTSFADDLAELQVVAKEHSDFCKQHSVFSPKKNYDVLQSNDLIYPIKHSAWKTAGQILCIAGAVMAVATAVYTVYEMYQYYHQDMNPIPRIIVNESSDEKGRAAYTYYECALCNRDAQGFGNDKLGDYGDMNGDVGKQWLALYTTKDKAAGDPITADIIAQKGSNKAPADKTTGIKLFGKGDTVNLVSEEFCYNDAFKGLYIFCGTEKSGAAETAKPTSSNTDASSAKAEDSSSAAADTSSAAAAAATEDSSSKSDNKETGSVVGTGTMAISCVGSAALGALICFFFVRKKKPGAAA